MTDPFQHPDYDFEPEQTAPADPYACKNCGVARPIVPGRSRRSGAKGYCGPCYMRWLRAGRPESGPPDSPTPSEARSRGVITVLENNRIKFEKQLVEYTRLRNIRYTPIQARMRMGIKERLGAKFEHAYQDSLS